MKRFYNLRAAGVHYTISFLSFLTPIKAHANSSDCTLRLQIQKAGFSLDEIFYFSQVQITEDVRQYLRKPTFDNWQWDEPEMLVLLQQMYIDLGFVTKFKIEVGIFFQKYFACS